MVLDGKCSALARQRQHYSPDDDNDEIQHVPTVPHVCVLVHHQTVGNNLQKGLDCENDEEGILNCFLWKIQRMLLELLVTLNWIKVRVLQDDQDCIDLLIMCQMAKTDASRATNQVIEVNIKKKKKSQLIMAVWCRSKKARRPHLPDDIVIHSHRIRRLSS